MPCLARLVAEEYKLPFGDGKHFFYSESACGSGCEEDICDKCGKKAYGPNKETLWHGLVSEPYTKKSHIFDGPWYHSKVATYGRPTEEVLERAMEAQKKARAGKRVSAPPVAKVTAPAPAPARAPAASSASSTSSATAVTKKTASKPDRPKVSVAEQLVEPTITAIPTAIKFVENEDEPLEISELRKIVLTVFEHEGRKYFLESATGSLWERNRDGQRGAFVGLWNEEDGEIECV